MLLAPAFAALVINVSAPADLSPTLLDRIIAETDAIWRPMGLTLIWNHGDPGAARSLEVVIGSSRGSARADSTDEPLGWIEFDAGVPRPEVYVSYTNAVDLLERSRGLVGIASQMPLVERETLIGRAMGRALAHELGHYALASKAHDSRGLMKATHTAWELFTTERRMFQITTDERARVEARMAAPSVLTGLGAPPAQHATSSGSSSPTCPPPASPRPGDPPLRSSTRS
jgi:hypothetical protein